MGKANFCFKMDNGFNFERQLVVQPLLALSHCWIFYHVWACITGLPKIRSESKSCNCFKSWRKHWIWLFCGDYSRVRRQFLKHSMKCKSIIWIFLYRDEQNLKDGFDKLVDNSPEKVQYVKRSLLQFANYHLGKFFQCNQWSPGYLFY